MRRHLNSTYAKRLRCILSYLALGSGALLIATHAAATPNTEPAPALSPNWPFEVVFESPPPAATPRPGSPCLVALQYATFITNGQSQNVPSLFAADAAFIGPEKRVLHGAEIAGFYDRVWQNKGAIPISFIDAGHECIMELANLRPNADGKLQYMLSASDHFTIGPDGKIERLVIFFRENVVQPPHPETGGASLPQPNTSP